MCQVRSSSDPPFVYIFPEFLSSQTCSGDEILMSSLPRSQTDSLFPPDASLHRNSLERFLLIHDKSILLHGYRSVFCFDLSDLRALSCRTPASPPSPTGVSVGRDRVHVTSASSESLLETRLSEAYRVRWDYRVSPLESRLETPTGSGLTGHPLTISPLPLSPGILPTTRLYGSSRPFPT